MPTSMPLKVLHDVIQAVMGWFDCHLWEFTIAERQYGLPPDEDWGTEPRFEAAKVRLRDVPSPGRTVLDYLYDFDDLPIKYARGRIANQRNAAKVRPPPNGYVPLVTADMGIIASRAMSTATPLSAAASSLSSHCWPANSPPPSISSSAGLPTPSRRDRCWHSLPGPMGSRHF